MDLDRDENGNASDRATLEAEFIARVADPSFPCLGAKAAINAGSYIVSVFDELGSGSSSKRVASELEAFARSDMRRTNTYATFVAIFRTPRNLDEGEFERLLWIQLQQLHLIDAKTYEWNPAVASDPCNPRFSFCFATQAFYVVGLHANSSRLARRFPWPTLVFNPHEQFERLRQEGKWTRMQEAIRAQDMALQGNINPMLSDFGERSEARQYAGRAVAEDWQAPFQVRNGNEPGAAARCPFAR